MSAGLVVIQGGCTPGIGSPDPRATDTAKSLGVTLGVASDAADRAAPPQAAPTTEPIQTTLNVASDAVDRAAPGNATSPVPSDSVGAGTEVPTDATPGTAPTGRSTPGRSPLTPARVAAVASPTSPPDVEVVAVALARDNRIALIDPQTGKLTRTVDVSRPPRSLAIAADGHSAWVFAAQVGGQAGGQAAVALFDVRTGDRHEDLQFHQGDNPAAVAFSTDGTRAYVALGGDQSSPPGLSTIVYTSSAGHEFGRVTVGRQTQGVQLRRQLSSLAISPGPTGDVLYAAGEGSGLVWAVDGQSGAVVSEIEVGGGPTSVVADPARQQVYVLLDTLNQIVAIDTTTLGITNRLDLPARPIGAVIGPDGAIFVTGGDANGEVWVVEPGATEIRSRVPIGGRPVGLAISSDGRSLYVADGATKVLDIITADTIQVTRTTSLASEPLGVAAVYPATLRQRQPLTPTPGVGTAPVATPQLVPAATPLPEGARPPDKLAPGAIAEPFVSGADNPVALAFAPDGRLFYNELRTGRVRVVQNGALLPDAFYQFAVSDQPGAGRVALALDPDFARNHYLYAFYTAAAAETPGGGLNTVVRLTDVGNKGTDLTPVLPDLPAGATHNSGTLRFGPDDKLYVSLGDVGQGSNAQDLSTLAGKIVRVNPDGSIPDDNPFVGEPDKQGAIWAYGLRDASSFAFHPIGHELLAVDNGATDNDELDLIFRGGNYGSPLSGYRSAPGVVDPIAVMNPPIGPTGSTFYTGDLMPEWKNDWFYCSSQQGQLHRVRLASGSFDRVAFEEVVKQGCTYDVVTGPDGALYYSDAKGIYRIRRPGAEVLPAVK